MKIKEVDVPFVLSVLSTIGATAVPALFEEDRLKLIEEAERYLFLAMPHEVAQGKVKQDLSVVESFPAQSLFHDLVRVFQCVWNKSVTPSFFPEPLLFNTMVLQRYAAKSIGITPHVDGKSRRNLVCVFVLDGDGEFGICSDRSGRNTTIIPAVPGDVILMRAPGFMGEEIMPFHFIQNIHYGRLVFGLRQKKIA